MWFMIHEEKTLCAKLEFTLWFKIHTKKKPHTVSELHLPHAKQEKYQSFLVMLCLRALGSIKNLKVRRRYKYIQALENVPTTNIKVGLGLLKCQPYLLLGYYYYYWVVPYLVTIPSIKKFHLLLIAPQHGIRKIHKPTFNFTFTRWPPSPTPWMRYISLAPIDSSFILTNKRKMENRMRMENKKFHLPRNFL